MLQSMRKMVKSWVAKTLIALLVLSFAAWGIGDIFISRSQGVVASVGDREVDPYTFANAFYARLEQIAQGGQEFDVAEAIRLGVDQAVLDEIGQRLALDNAAADLGLSAPDSAVSEAIVARPAFQDAAGRFDAERYARLLSANQMSQKDFEASVRHDVARTALVQAVASGSALPKSFVMPLYGRLGEERTLSYVAIGPDPANPPPTPTEGAVAAYLEENEAVYRRPAEADVAFLWVDPEFIAEPELVAEEEARDIYDLDLDLYVTPATRNIRQIVFETEEEAAGARERLDGGGTLLDIAGEQGLSPESVILGRVAREELAPELAEAAFGTTETGPVGPFKTAFGWAVQEIVTIDEASVVPFEEVRTDIIRSIAADAALDRIPDIVARAEDRMAAGESLEAIAPLLGLELQLRTIDEIGRAVDLPDGARMPEDPDFLDAAFELQPGDDPDVIYFESGAAAILRVDAYHESAVPPLADVREGIIAALESNARAASALAAAESAGDRLLGGERLESVADSLGLEIVKTEPVQRYGRGSLPRDVLNRAFALPLGGHAVGEGIGEEAYVFRIDEIIPEDPEAVNARIESLLPTLEGMIDNEVFQTFSGAVNSEYPLQVNRAGVEAALGLLSDS